MMFVACFNDPLEWTTFLCGAPQTNLWKSNKRVSLRTNSQIQPFRHSDASFLKQNKNHEDVWFRWHTKSIFYLNCTTLQAYMMRQLHFEWHYLFSSSSQNEHKMDGYIFINMSTYFKQPLNKALRHTVYCKYHLFLYQNWFLHQSRELIPALNYRIDILCFKAISMSLRNHIDYVCLLSLQGSLVEQMYYFKDVFNVFWGSTICATLWPDSKFSHT